MTAISARDLAVNAFVANMTDIQHAPVITSANELFDGIQQVRLVEVEGMRAPVVLKMWFVFDASTGLCYEAQIWDDNGGWKFPVTLRTWDITQIKQTR